MITLLSLLLWLIFSSSSLLSITAYPKQMTCIDKERSALLNFKAGLKIPSHRLSSWSEHREDCCQWMGVRCHNKTGRVTRLYLRNPCDYYGDYDCQSRSILRGNITSALLELKFLSHLDLSKNDFGGSSIPTFLGSMGSLTHLNLSYSEFSGMIPHQLGNLSSIRFLDLSGNQNLYVNDLSWMTGLHSLEYLDMSSVNLQNATNWFQAVSMLPSLSQLHLSSCDLENWNISSILVISTSLQVLDLSFNQLNFPIPHEIGQLKHLEHLSLRYNSLHGLVPQSLGNLSSLRTLDLSKNQQSGPIPQSLGNLTSLIELFLFENQFSGPIPQSLGNLSSLRKLDLSKNQLSGPIPQSLGNLTSLRELVLFENQLSGPIPHSLGNLSSLKLLSLYDNQLNDTVPKSICLLSNLEHLDIAHNYLSGNISEAYLSKFPKLIFLHISFNSLFFLVDPKWIPPFQLDILQASHCLIGPKFPLWLRTQTSLSMLDISHSGISEIAPDWLWDFSSHLYLVDFNGNQISGDISNVFLNASIVNLASNKFTGHVPRLSPNVEEVYLSNNSLSGDITNFFGRKEHRGNNLEVLNLSDNTFSGGLSNECLIYWQSLNTLNLARNNLSGHIPSSVGFLYALESLQMQNNNLIGNIPLSLKNCTQLAVINFANNQLTGALPYWIANMTNLLALKLRNNNFGGNIHLQIWKLPSLIILDLANNFLSGSIPKNISLLAMTYKFVSTSGSFYTAEELFPEALDLLIEKTEREYQEILGFVRSIDLSINNLIGLIPDEISTLTELLFLNLSNNQFKGNIPENFGRMKNLLALDLSRNHLSGKIPQSLSSLTLLNSLDLSYNKLSGQIPSGIQLQSFNETSYIGNDGLCGAPLRKSCTKEKGLPEVPMSGDEEEDDDRFETSWCYFGMGCGFGLAFLGVWGTLFFKRTWRHVYFRFVEDMTDKIYVVTLVKVNWFRRMIKWSNGN